MQQQGEQLWTIALLYVHLDCFLLNGVKLITVWDLVCEDHIRLKWIFFPPFFVNKVGAGVQTV